MPKQALVSASTIAKDVGEGLTKRAVLRWARLNRIPSIRINKRVIRFDPVAVRKRLKQTLL